MSARTRAPATGGGGIDLDDYAFELPAERIAQHPPAERDGGRMLVLDRRSGDTTHSSIRELAAWLQPGDLLVHNATRVLPARLRGRKATGGRAEALVLGPDAQPNCYRALVRISGPLRPGIKLRFARDERTLDAEIASLHDGGVAVLACEPGTTPYEVGETPLPPYIHRQAPDPRDPERYQTTYARVPGSVAAPTAGLHLSERLLAQIDARGVARAEVVLHVGPGTFRPLDAEALASGRLHPESFELPDAAAQDIATTRERGGRVVAVGTTTARVLESCVAADGRVAARRGETDLFLRPGSRFRVVDALLTNFHLPRSSLLLLVCAFAGRSAVLDAYREALRENYRFYSYGDAMLVR